MKIHFSKAMFDSLVIGGPRESANVRERIEQFFRSRLQLIDQQCGLTDVQFAKLELANRGDTRRMFGTKFAPPGKPSMSVRRCPREGKMTAAQDENHAVRHHSHVNPLRRPFPSWEKVLQTHLTETQRGFGMKPWIASRRERFDVERLRRPPF